MSADSPFVLARVTVEAVDRVSPTFARITFGGADLADVGTVGRTLDQRIKLLFPGTAERPAEFANSGSDWYEAWLALPDESRGAMRTYSIRDVVVDDAGTRLIVDFVLHLDPASSGPASLWADAAQPGDELLILGPRRGRTDAGGIEYAPGDARSVILVGDETAAPAIARILEDIDRGTCGVAFIEVPLDRDILHIDAPAGVDVRWLPRAERDHGTTLIAEVLDYLGAPTEASIGDVATEELLWETPTYSGLGEEIVQADNRAERYFWIAGESAVVTTLRRHLVKDLGIDRAQVAFMGYWRKGVAMRA